MVWMRSLVVGSGTDRNMKGSNVIEMRGQCEQTTRDLSCREQKAHDRTQRMDRGSDAPGPGTSPR